MTMRLTFQWISRKIHGKKKMIFGPEKTKSSSPVFQTQFGVMQMLAARQMRQKNGSMSWQTRLKFPVFVT